MSEVMTVEQALRHIGDRLTFPKTREDFRIAHDAMQSLRAALPRWIPVEERLPEVVDSLSGECVIAWADGWVRPRQMRYASNGYAKTEKGRAPRWEEPDGRLSFLGNPTHWMPLPAPPTQEEQE